MIESLHQRARAIRQRRLVLAWEYRQRHLSKGVWYRLRRVLADAESAWSIMDAEADSLYAEGYAQLTVGQELQPVKRIFFLPSAKLESLSHRRKLAVRLSAELLAAPNLVLVRHGQ